MSDEARQKPPPPSDANPMWGGRFATGPAEVMDEINPSIDFDRRFYAQDIAGSKAHCSMLVAQGILTREDGDAITTGLDRIQGEIDSNEASTLK